MFRSLDLQNLPPDQGFQFPGTFELSAMGAAAGIAVLRETVVVRSSSAGRFVSVRISFYAESREQYEAAHTALRAHPEVKWTV